MKATAINWCDSTFNPWEGCTKIGGADSACANCYAAANDARHLHGNLCHWGKGAPRRVMTDAYWKQPLAWDLQALKDGKRLRVFCASTADWADDEAPAGQRERLFELIKQTPNLDWLLLTKRAGKIRKHLPPDWGKNGYPNVWLGVTVENIKYGLPRIDVLREIPAACRFLSCEPLLEDLGKIDLKGIHWVIAGGETGKDVGKKTPELVGAKKATLIRSMHVKWVESLLNQCQRQKPQVAFWFKQLGKLPVGLDGQHLELRDEAGKRSPNGENWNEWPENLAHLRIREIPDFHLTEMEKVEGSLNKLAASLDKQQAAKEVSLRTRLLDAEKKLFQTREDRAQVIKEYHALYNPLRKWASFCKAVSIPKRTAYDLLKVARESEANRAKSARLDSEPKPEPTLQEIAEKAKSTVERLLSKLSEKDRAKALKLILAILQAEDVVQSREERGVAKGVLQMRRA